MYLNTTLPCYLGLLVCSFWKLFYTFLNNVLSLNCELLSNCNDKLGLPIDIRVTTYLQQTKSHKKVAISYETTVDTV